MGSVTSRQGVLWWIIYLFLAASGIGHRECCFGFVLVFVLVWRRLGSVRFWRCAVSVAVLGLLRA